MGVVATCAVLVIARVIGGCSLDETGTGAFDASLCTAGEIVCSGACANLSQDNLNCGGCGIACAAGEVCSQGKCSTTCGGGTTQCGDKCVDEMVDPNNCGACGAYCGVGSQCSQGKCVS